MKLSDVDLTQRKFKNKRDYLAELKVQQTEMLKIQQAYYHQGKAAVVVFEGWDASGKGGAIRRMTQGLDPRGFQVHPIAAPTQTELAQHYLQRFQIRLPHQGTIAIFDRSWYGRVLVERVEDLIDPSQLENAFIDIRAFEESLINEGIKVVKFFMHISPDEQLRRFQERLSNPVKRWKLTVEDIRNRSKWNEYEQAIDEMIEKTGTTTAPWHIIPGNFKWTSRIKVLETLTDALSSGVDISIPPIDKKVRKLALNELGIKPK